MFEVIHFLHLTDPWIIMNYVEQKRVVIKKIEDVAIKCWNCFFSKFGAEVIILKDWSKMLPLTLVFH